jgi:hypothetical protein
MTQNVLLSIFPLTLSQRTGQAALATVFIIGSIVVLMGVTIAFFAESFVNSAYGFQAAERAQAVAYAGALDALMQLDRNKDFSSPGGYSVNVGSNSATVTVTQDVSNSKVTITSSATVNFRQRKVVVVASVNSTTGQIFVVSWSQS